MNRRESFELPQIIARYRTANPPLSPRFRQQLRDQLRTAATGKPPRLSASIVQDLKPRARDEGSVRVWQRMSFRLTAAAGVALLAAAGMIVHLHSINPTPVSAQSVLDRAGSVGLPPNRVIHQAYRLAMPGEVPSLDIWIETNSRGAVVRTAGTQTERVGGVVFRISRWVDNGRIYRSYVYQPSGNMSIVQKYSLTDAQLKRLEQQIDDPLSRSGFGPDDWYNPRAVARFLSKLARRAPKYVHLLPKRSLDGVSVYPVKVDRGPNWPAMTAYFDSPTYGLRGIDGGTGPHGSVTPNFRLVTYKAVPFSAVPPHTFEFHLPKGALIIP